MDFSLLLPVAEEFDRTLREAKEREAPPKGWYPYGSLSNLIHLDRLLTGENRRIADFIGDGPVADIGAADGDMAYFVHQTLDVEVDIVDNAPTNWNGLEGARLLGELLGTPVPVHEVDLDSQFALPRPAYSLVIFLGILYHLQNPYYALQALSAQCHHLLLSTRVAAQTADGQVRLDQAPVAYLVDPTETNNDATNYWIFSVPGLERIVHRAGWRILDQMTVGRTEGDSDPSHPERDERAFMLLESTRPPQLD